ncbi:MAG: YfhO family protein, partial [Ruminococcus sp.]|nr:YfhO family protein [Ruminococcus sp.]
KGEGWTAKVDGNDTEITPVAHALTAFKLSQGKHEISLNYVPKGFTKGMIISIIGLVLFVGYTVFIKLRKKKISLLDFGSSDEEDEVDINETAEVKSAE